MARSGMALLLLVGAVLLVSSCIRRQYMVHRRITGTCAGACERYETCKYGNESSDDNHRGQVYQTCIAECGDFFSEEAPLRELESLDCPDILAFIDGA